jgi:PAS domain-containing protein
LMGLSLRQSTSLVVTVSLAYSILTIYALISFHEYHVAIGLVSPRPLFWLFQRVGLFLVLCGLAIYLAHYRADTGRILSRLRIILSKLPAPVVLSDASGNIVYANDAVTSVVRQSPSSLTGNSYFDFFRTEAMKGKSIHTYVNLFESDTNGTFELEVSPFGSANKMTVQLICLGTGANRRMITVFSNFEKLQDHPSLYSGTSAAKF